MAVNRYWVRVWFKGNGANASSDWNTGDALSWVLTEGCLQVPLSNNGIMQFPLANIDRFESEDRKNVTKGDAS
jgi:hypothetical protein